MSDAIVEIISRNNKDNYAVIYNKNEKIFINQDGKVVNNKEVYDDKTILSYKKD